MKSDLEIARETGLRHILDIASSIGIGEDEAMLCGRHKAKLALSLLERLRSRPEGKLVMVTAMTPTAYGEGKTTTAIGLSMAFNRIGRRSIVTLRQPSLGPVFGLKGGAAGGGYAQVLPMEDINLHFTGDIHAVASAHNLVSAMVDNHIYQGNELDIFSPRVVFPRTVDHNDRALRDIIVALGGTGHGVPREDSFIITAASEVMAVLSLSMSLAELRERLGRIIVAYRRNGQPVTVSDLGVQGAMTAMLKDALQPNLVQTTEGTPALIHCGPFANIAHGTNSILATRMALHMADVVVTETGFGSDLGAEKFFHIVAPQAGLNVHGVVLVVSLRAIKFHGGASKEEIMKISASALRTGMANALRHVAIMRLFGVPVVVALNRFPGDSEEEVQICLELFEKEHVPVSASRVFEQGGEGGVDLARLVSRYIDASDGHYQNLYQRDDTVEQKIGTIARRVYGAGQIMYQLQARKDLKEIASLGFSHLPICVAKTPHSLSDEAKAIGVPRDFDFTVRTIHICAGAGFLVPVAGDIMLMPGLPKRPAALNADVDQDGRVSGLF